VELEDVRSMVKQRDAYILKLQKDADAVWAEVEQEKKRTEGKLQPQGALFLPETLGA
jgi:predicted transcriptional regulator